MLAYVFWHWPQPGVDTETYVDHLVSFHRTLNANKPRGFNGSRVFRMHGVSWLDTTGDAYEDWYLLDDSAALDQINEAAVSGACEVPHNLVAREAAGGTAGLYRIKIGDVFAELPRFALWLSKPATLSYRDFYETLSPVMSEGALWQRQMTLGPTTEFVIHSESPILELPDDWTASQLLTLQLVDSDQSPP